MKLWHYLVTGALLAGLATAVGLSVMQREAPLTQPDATAHATAAPELETGLPEPDFGDPFFETGGEGPLPPAGPPPKRIVHVPDGTAPVPDEAFDWQDLTTENLLPLSVEAVAAALDGNLKAADLLINVQQQCRRLPTSDESISHWAERATEFHGRTRGRRPGFFGLFEPQPTQAENEAMLRSWSGACQDLRKVWDDSISSELARLAEQGHVTARLMFAMFPPVADAGGVIPFAQQFGWEALAREYSWLNLQSGAPEGFLAFGQSYLNGLFTPRDFTLSAAFLKAAMECGQTELASGGIVTRFESADAQADSGRWHGAQQAAQMLTYYEGIIGYCR